MKILFCGDVVGKAGRRAIEEHLPLLRKNLELDFVVVNGENSASGFGITKAICDDIIKAGADVITGGDHCFDQKETMFFIGDYEKLLRPANLPEKLPGKGFGVFESKKGKRVLVIHLHAQLFMKLTADSPFECAEKILKNYNLGKNIDAIIVDFHGEATSEKMAMGHYLDGRVSMVVGSHTHVPTADTMILDGGTAYQTDAGMCGDYNSVIGFNKNISLSGFLNKVRTEKLVPEDGVGTLCGVMVETDDKTGLAVNVKQIKVGGRIGD